ncbi:MAG: hypothetical protein MK159_02065 [Halobacteriales archaeon]|nr:hypothetical protein [Halobacteriales archaeon]|tara:strand:- start:181 stop:681 length:501 start_codon:yes stop_codon:yes gene_type:complete
MVEKKSGLIGTYKYSAKKSRSLVFKSYVVISSMVGIFVIFLITLAGITWTANPVGTGPFREQILLGAILLGIMIPLVAPVFIVSRRQQKDRSTVRNEDFIGGSGYGYIVSLFIGLGIIDPNDHKLNWPLESVGLWIDSLPGSYGVVVVVLSIGMIVAIERKTRKLN